MAERLGIEPGMSLIGLGGQEVRSALDVTRRLRELADIESFEVTLRKPDRRRPPPSSNVPRPKAQASTPLANAGSSGAGMADARSSASLLTSESTLWCPSGGDARVFGRLKVDVPLQDSLTTLATGTAGCVRQHPTRSDRVHFQLSDGPPIRLRSEQLRRVEESEWVTLPEAIEIFVKTRLGMVKAGDGTFCSVKGPPYRVLKMREQEGRFQSALLRNAILVWYVMGRDF